MGNSSDEGVKAEEKRFRSLEVEIVNGPLSHATCT